MKFQYYLREIYEIDTKPSDTVWEIKKKLSQIIKVRAGAIRIYHENNQISNMDSISFDAEDFIDFNQIIKIILWRHGILSRLSHYFGC